jgi:hypothetical protein
MLISWTNSNAVKIIDTRLLKKTDYSKVFFLSFFQNRLTICVSACTWGRSASVGGPRRRARASVARGGSRSAASTRPHVYRLATTTTPASAHAPNITPCWISRRLIDDGSRSERPYSHAHSPLHSEPRQTDSRASWAVARSIRLLYQCLDRLMMTNVFQNVINIRTCGWRKLYTCVIYITI